MINKVILIGNLGGDPEIRTLESKTKVAKFSLATNESYKDKSDQWQTATEWHDIVAWRHLAERTERDLKKGSLVYIEGKLTHRKWDDNDGNTRYFTEVVANTIRLLEKRESNNSGYNSFPTEEPKNIPQSQESNNFNTANPSQNTGPNPSADDDLPF